MAEPYYTTADDLRTLLGVDESTLSDASALELILDAEDMIDEYLGGRGIDTTTGRKVIETDVEAWQWDKLARATLKLAAKIYENDSLLDGAEWDSVSGPDYSFSGRITSGLEAIAGPQILAILNQSGLREMTGKAASGRSYNSDLADRFYTREGGQPVWSRKVWAN